MTDPIPDPTDRRVAAIVHRVSDPGGETDLYVDVVFDESAGRWGLRGPLAESSPAALGVNRGVTGYAWVDAEGGIAAADSIVRAAVVLRDAFRAADPTPPPPA